MLVAGELRNSRDYTSRLLFIYQSFLNTLLEERYYITANMYYHYLNIGYRCFILSHLILYLR